MVRTLRVSRMVGVYKSSNGQGGFRYLLDNSVVYQNAHHAHATTETIVGHATLATGAHPSDHGLVGNTWFDRSSGKLTSKDFVTSRFYYDEYPQWVSSFNAAGDELTLDFAKELIENEEIGADAVTDYLSVSFSSTDYVGHLFGASSLEAEDNLLRLDRTLASLLAFVDENVGLENTLIVLSADHGGRGSASACVAGHRRRSSGDHCRDTGQERIGSMPGTQGAREIHCVDVARHALRLIGMRHHATHHNVDGSEWYLPARQNRGKLRPAGKHHRQ